MADRFYGLDAGITRLTAVAEAASTNSTDIELRVADTVTKKLDVLLALDVLKQAILADQWPPA